LKLVQIAWVLATVGLLFLFLLEYFYLKLGLSPCYCFGTKDIRPRIPAH
jgi:hypothetical protein